MVLVYLYIAKNSIRSINLYRFYKCTRYFVGFCRIFITLRGVFALQASDLCRELN